MKLKFTNIIGLVGCIREIWLDGVFLESRHMVRTNRTTGQVSIDNCQLVDPCKRPNACEHDGKCSVIDDNVICDCKGTGYIGKNCHFGKNKHDLLVIRMCSNIIKLF